MFLYCGLHDHSFSAICKLIEKWAKVWSSSWCSWVDAGCSCSSGGSGGEGGVCGGSAGHHN
eukprot:14013658-Ditylum_brightwellii.AAC.1